MYKGKVFDEMRLMGEGFELKKLEYSLFMPEFEVASKINEEIEKMEQITRRDAIKLIEIFNSINSQEHHNGSSWLDYKIHFSGLLKMNGYKVEWVDEYLRLD